MFTMGIYSNFANRYKGSSKYADQSTELDFGKCFQNNPKIDFESGKKKQYNCIAL